MHIFVDCFGIQAKLQGIWDLHFEIHYQNHTCTEIDKGQLISKADWRAIDSPKKRTDEFVLFAVKSKKANKSNSSVRFLGESTARQSAFGFI